MPVANTIAAVANGTNPLAAAIMNRETKVDEDFVWSVLRQTQFSWHGRRPRPAFNSRGEPCQTDLDLLSLLTELYKRQESVTLSHYDNRTPPTVVAGRQRVGSRRFGPITGLIAHPEQLSFSIRINDQSVLHTDSPDLTFGAERSYMIADYNGAWHDGWHGVSWGWSEAEAAFFARRQLVRDGSIPFADYVHPHRKQSIYGAPYLLAKLLWQRLNDEIAHYRSEQKRLESLGIELPDDLTTHEPPVIYTGESVGVSVPVFRMEVVGPEFTGAYPLVSADEVGYRLAVKLERYLSRQLRPLVQFVVRADEVAFYRFGLDQTYTPWWIISGAWLKSPSGSRGTFRFTRGLTLEYQRGQVEKRVAA